MVEYEEWRPIEGFQYYEISNLGNVRSLDHRVNSIYGTRLHRGKLLKKHSNKKRFGYVYIALRKDAIAYTRSVHRLVAKAFIPNPDNKPQVNHIDRDVTNNRADNLEWVTAKENSQWAIKGGRNLITRERPIVSTNIETGEKTYYKNGMEAHRKGFDRRRTWEAMTGRKKSYKGFTWAYAQEKISMIKFESHCCGCPSNIGCIGDHCMYRYTPVYTCDECKEEVDELYEYDGTQVCLDCLLDIINAKRVK